MPKRARHSSDTTGNASSKYLVKFNPSWSVEYPWLRGSGISVNHGFCRLCSVNYSVAHSGKWDVKQHGLSDKHKSNEENTKVNRTVADMFKPAAEKNDTLKSEVLFTNFLVEHNLPFLIADHFTELVPHMFPDSAIAKKFSCKRTKTTMIVTNAIAPYYDNEVTRLCQNEKFCLMVDESNDKGDDKCMVVLVRIYDKHIDKVTTKFLGIPICNYSTAEDLFTCIDKMFT